MVGGEIRRLRDSQKGFFAGYPVICVLATAEARNDDIELEGQLHFAGSK